MSRGTVPPPDHEQPTLLARLQATRTGHRLRRWWAKHHDVAIRDGVGKGLRFKAGYNLAYADGNNEWHVQEALAKYLRPGDVFYDIGANVGFLTVIGARLVGAGGHVIAFEPVPENAAAVRHNCALNGFGNVRIFEMAVADEVGKGTAKCIGLAADPPRKTEEQPEETLNHHQNPSVRGRSASHISTTSSLPPSEVNPAAIR